MSSKPLAFVLLALGCLTAAAGGAYVATRHNASDPVATVASQSPAPAASTASAPVAAQAAAPQPVAETEAAVSPSAPATKPLAEAAPVEPPPARPAREVKTVSKPQAPARAEATAANRPAPRNTPAAPSAARVTQAEAPTQPAPAAPAAWTPPPAAPPQPEPGKPVEGPQPEPDHVPEFEEDILPSSAVNGLQAESSTSTEKAHLEDRVDARVSRDVMAAGRVAIPAGSRVIGSVTMVERGGKMKEQARLGIRFHTLVLADGTQVALHTDQVMRLGEAPAASSTKKIGGAAVGGAILGAILGGGKGAAAGGAIGAGAGSAAVMAGDRSTATLRQGEYLNVKLSSPVTITVPRRE